MSTLNDWLKDLYDGEREKVASTSIEDELMKMPPEELLKIATTGHMSQERRESLPAKAFAVPEKKAKKLGVASEIKGEAKGKYPIPDPKHARNALARVAQHGTPGEKAAVEKKVHDRFPGIGKEAEAKLAWADTWGRQLAQIETDTTKVAGFGQKIKTLFGATGGKKTAAELAAQIRARSSPMARIAEAVKKGSAHCGKIADMEAQADFTSPEAQQKAKVVQQAMKATKGAPPHIRKAAVKVTAEKLKHASIR